eukprot:Hpha_TRINITY_DN23002_c0_g1::TRINITY_DN23002_c0_g1_i1::g.109264::m.109264
MLRFAVALGVVLAAEARLVTFSNTAPRRDASGTILNAHDGTTQRFSPHGPFFYHAMSYGLCKEPGGIDGCTNSCIYDTNNTLYAWSSADMVSGSWTRHGQVFAPGSGAPTCTLFRPQAVYNPATRLYVVWANAAGCSACPPGFQDTCYVTATSPAPGGPFTYRGVALPNASLLGNVSGYAGDYALFADADGRGYAILTHGI